MRTCRIGFQLVTTAAALLYVSSCTPGTPKRGEEPGPATPVTTEPPAPAEDLPGQVATFADEACACEDRACADAVTGEFNEWAEAHSDAVGTTTAGNEIAAQVARMAACADNFDVPLPEQGAPCTQTGECAEGLECLRYRGIAGDQGPELTSCEIPCGPRGSCPDGMKCADIADGPGKVCRP